jgi:C-terminal processing protease CtpA/Prc
MATNSGTRRFGLIVGCLLVALLVRFGWGHHRHIASAPAAAAPLTGVGVALRFDSRTTTFRIDNVVSNTPAFRAGLKRGLIISRIDDTDTEGKKLLDIVNRIRGPAGTSVRLELIDPNGGETNVVDLKRESLPIRQDNGPPLR